MIAGNLFTTGLTRGGKMGQKRIKLKRMSAKASRARSGIRKKGMISLWKKKEKEIAGRRGGSMPGGLG